jgi:serine-type D-Ala-D-Ala carboxypeptidase (penicillin-binding protein 5/6)
LPMGSFLKPLTANQSGRVLGYATGDRSGGKSGQVWLSLGDVAPSGPPPWLTDSQVEAPAGAPSPPAPPPHFVRWDAPPVVTAEQLAVLDDGSGLMIYGLDPHTPEPPASTTKIATAIVTLEHAPSLDTTVRVSVDGGAMALADGSSIMGLVPGQRLTIRTLLYGLLLPSGNDAAEQLASSVAESRDQFVMWMNDLASQDLGLDDTHFVNPSGLDADGHYSSAYDLAQLARRGMRNDIFRDIVSTPQVKTDGLTLAGHNPLIGAYAGADGVKTGTTDAAGLAIVGSATRKGHRVYVVVIHSDDLLADCSALFDWAWRSFEW